MKDHHVTPATPQVSAVDAAVDAAIAADVSQETPPQESVQAAPDAPVEVTPDPQPAAVASPTPAAPAGSVPPQYSEAAQALLLQNDGDWNKAAEQYWQLARDRELARRETAPPPQEPTPVVDPEIQQFDSELSSLETGFQSLATAFQTVTNQKADLEEKRTDVVNRLASPELDADIPALQRELKKLNSDLGRVLQKEQQIKADAISNRNQHKTVSTVKAYAVKTQSLLQARQEQEATRYEERVNTVRGSFDSALATASQQIPEKFRAKFIKAAKAETLLWLQTPDASGVRPVITDAVAHFTQQAKDYLSDFEEHHRAKSAEYSALKQKDAQISAPAGKDAVAPSSNKPKTVKDWDAHLEGAQF